MKEQLGRGQIENKVEEALINWITASAYCEPNSQLTTSLNSDSPDFQPREVKNPLLVIRGQKGIGKSYVINKLLTRLQESMDIFVARVEGNDQSNLFQIIQELLKFVQTRHYSIDYWWHSKKAANPELKISDLTATRCIELIDYILHPETNKIESEIEPKSFNRDLKYAIKTVLSLAAAGRPLILVVSNYHLLQAYNDYFEDLISNQVPEQKTFSILTTESTDIPLNPLLLEKCNYTEYELGALDTEESKRLILEYIPELKLADQDWVELANVNQGSPEYILEFIQQLAQEGIIRFANGTADKYEVVNPILMQDLNLDWNTILADRLQCFSEDQKYLLRIAAVIGEYFSVNILKKLLLMLIPGRELPVAKLLSQLEAMKIIHQVKLSYSSQAKYRYVNRRVWLYFYRRNATNSLQIIHWYIANEYLSEFNPQLPVNMSKIPLVIEHLERSHRYLEAHTITCLMLKHSINSAMLNSCEYWIERAKYQWRHLNVASAGRESIMLLYYTALYFYHSCNHNKALEYCNLIFGEESSESAHEKMAEVRLLRAHISIHQGNFQLASTDLNEAIAIAQETECKDLEGRCYSAIGIMQKLQGNLDLARRYFEQDLAIKRELKNIKGEAIVIGNIALIFRQQGDLPRALELSQKAMELRGNSDLTGTAVHLTNLASILADMHQFQKAIEMQDKALLIYRDIKHPLGEALAMGNQGINLRRILEYERARRNLEQALKRTKALDNKRLFYYFLGELAELNRMEQQHELATEQVTAAIKGLSDLNDKVLLGVIVCYYGLLLYNTNHQAIASEQLERAKKIQSEVGGNQQSELGRLITHLSDCIYTI